MEHLHKYGYERTAHTGGLFKHKTQDITVTLVVDNFEIKYTNQEDVDHLVAVVRDKYPFEVDWEAKQYVGIHLKWDYEKRELWTLMDRYVEQALKEFKHTPPKQHFKGPSQVDRPEYG